MDILQLRQMGMMTSHPLIKQEVTIKYYPLKPEDQWQHPATPERETEQVEGSVTFWIRKFTAGDGIALATAKTFDQRAYEAIHRSVFSEDGTPVFPTIEETLDLDLEMFGPLLLAINEINGVDAKKSQPRTNGGASSHSHSADAPLQNGRKRSVKPKGKSGVSIETSTGR